jgi:hypothetical protein
VFRVTVGKLLGFLVSYRGIEANPKKIKTIEAMRHLAHIKDVHKFTGVTPSFNAKTECVHLCVPGSIFTHKTINSKINSITSVYYNVS